MMDGFTLFVLCSVATQVTSHQIRVKCDEIHEFPRYSNTPPSKLAGLKVAEVKGGGNPMLKISWAVNIDASIRYLESTWIDITQEPSYICQYIPPWKDANLTGLEQEWFHYSMPASSGSYDIHAFNLPFPPVGIESSSMTTSIKVQNNLDQDLRNVTTKPVHTKSFIPSVISTPEPTSLCLTVKDVTLIIFGVLAALMILSSCYIIYKNWGPNTAPSLDFDFLSLNPMAPVPVLVVYPAVNSAFQGAVVALAEFLQLHCSYKVSIDMWQQGRIAELGPMRWLAEEAKAVDRVLIVSPQAEASSSQLSHSLNPKQSIPATAHDLYPLILNMVASHAKNAEDLAKFWVVQLNEKKDCRLLPLELRACKTFCLMKDLNKLCRCLHAQRDSKKKLSDVIFRPAVLYSKQSTVKLEEATEKLCRNKRGMSTEVEQGTTVLTVV